jgi:hypothetical protein
MLEAWIFFRWSPAGEVTLRRPEEMRFLMSVSERIISI